MFSFFSRKVSPVSFVNKIYINTAAKHAACIQLAKADENIVFISWFDETTAVFKKLPSQNDIREGRILEAKAFHSAKMGKHKPVFLEHFPLAAIENELIKNRTLGEVEVYSALDEPILQRFGGDKVKELLVKMGLKESEMIEHPVIGKAILYAQADLAKKVNFTSSALSQEEWCKKNIDQRNSV